MKLRFMAVLFVVLLIHAPVIALAGEAQPGKPADPGNEVNGMEREMKKVAAKVNGVDIAMGSVIRMMKQINSNEKIAAATAEEMAALRGEAIKRLILQELVYQKAKAEGLTTDSKKLDEAIADLKQKLGDEGAYKSFLATEKTTEAELRDQADRSLTLQRMYEKEVSEKSVVTEEQIRNMYEKYKDKFIRPSKVTAVDIVFFLKVDDPDSVKKAETVIKSMGEEKDPWTLVSDGTFLVRDIEIGREKDEELYKAAEGLKPGELSGVVRTPDSLHIIKLKEFVTEKQFSLDEMRPALKMKLMGPAQKRRLEEWEKELRKDAKIEVYDAEGKGLTTGPGTKK